MKNRTLRVGDRVRIVCAYRHGELATVTLVSNRNANVNIRIDGTTAEIGFRASELERIDDERTEAA